MKRAIFPGSFDPLTLGHCEIIKKAEAVFDEIIVAVGINDEKKYQFSIDQRLKFIEDEFLGNSKIIVDKYLGLTADYCKKVESKYIIRGLRNPADFEFEKAIAQIKGTEVSVTERFTSSGGEQLSNNEAKQNFNPTDSKYRGSQGIDPDLIKELEKLCINKNDI